MENKCELMREMRREAGAERQYKMSHDCVQCVVFILFFFFNRWRLLRVYDVQRVHFIMSTHFNIIYTSVLIVLCFFLYSISN